MKILLVLLALASTTALAQDIHHHDGASAAVDYFYSTWFMPDAPTKSCCNKVDCYAVKNVEQRNGVWYAERREDHKMIRIPPEKIERRRDSPDINSHLCAPPPNTPVGDVVFCFVLGTGT